MQYSPSLKELLGLKYPIVQAPMAGGATTPALVAAVSNAGALGSFAAGYLPPSEIEKAIKEIRRLTEYPFAVNLFVPEPHYATQSEMEAACLAINECSAELNFQVTPPNPPYAPHFEEQVGVLLKAKVPIFSFTFNIPPPGVVERFKAMGACVMGTATTLEEGLALKKAGVDVVVAQGAEAGGHRGSFLKASEDSLLALENLLDELITHLELPIIAAGGIMNGKAIAKSLQKGASAAQLGTAFLCCDESGIAEIYKKALLAQEHNTTVLTRAFSGKLARGINNRFIDCMSHKAGSVLPYPIQNKLTASLRAQAKRQQNPDYLSLWAGESVFLSRACNAKGLVAALIDELESAQIND